MEDGGIGMNVLLDLGWIRNSPVKEQLGLKRGKAQRKGFAGRGPGTYEPLFSAHDGSLYPSYDWKIREVLCPPKPKELLMAARTLPRLAREGV